MVSKLSISLISINLVVLKLLNANNRIHNLHTKVIKILEICKQLSKNRRQHYLFVNYLCMPHLFFMFFPDCEQAALRRRFAWLRRDGRREFALARTGRHRQACPKDNSQKGCFIGFCQESSHMKISLSGYIAVPTFSIILFRYAVFQVTSISFVIIVII